MTPDIELQLKAVLKSLTDNVSQAVDPTNQLAMEQLSISLATLKIIITHLPYVHGFIREDISQQITIAENLKGFLSDESEIKQLTEATTESRYALSDPARGFTRLQFDARSLRDVVSTTIRDLRDEDIDVDLAKMILEFSKPTIAMGQSWNKPHGFEPRPDQVGELHDLFNESIRE